MSKLLFLVGSRATSRQRHLQKTDGQSINWQQRPRLFFPEELATFYSSFKARTRGYTRRKVPVGLQPFLKDKASSHHESSRNIQVLKDVQLGRLLLKHKNCQTEFADNG